MASTINTGNIDTTYPIAGQDNDSQGFRDNFTNTNTNFIAAKEEIEDLQAKVILKSALQGGALDNDMAGALISNAQVQGVRETVLNTGNVTGAIVIDVPTAPYQKIVPTAATSISFTNFSTAGTHSAIRVEISITDVTFTVTLPAEVTIGVTGIQTIASNVITFPTTGTYVLEFSSIDNGTTIVVNDLTQARIANRQFLVAAPAASIGAAGDLAGMIAYDATYIYVCAVDYDGTTSIWHRALAATW